MTHQHSKDHHHHHHHDAGNIKVAFWLNTAFALFEIAGGLYTNSVAILSDALHDFGDSLSLGFAHYFQKKSTKKRDKNFSYGYKRFSLLGAFLNSAVLLIGSLFIIKEAIERILEPSKPDARGMLFFALVGVVVNLIAMLRLRKGKSINERVVSLHFLEDVLGWVAVLIGSIIMLFADLPVLDPILSLAIASYILFNIYKNLREAFHIVLQGIPEDVDIDEVSRRVISIDGVIDIHDLHSWTMDGNYNILTLHVVLSQQSNTKDTNTIKEEVRKQLRDLKIHHITIETEQEGDPCLLKNC